MRKYFVYCLIATFLICAKGFSKNEEYSTLNEKINSTENKIIKDFYFKIPDGYSNNYDKENHLKLGKNLENKYKEQLLNFEEIERKLSSMRQNVSTKKVAITEKEKSKLITAIDYSKIILKSRKEEIYETYHHLKEKLGHKLSLRDLYNKIKTAKFPGSCKVSKISLDQSEKELRFSIHQHNGVSGHRSTEFIIHKDELFHNKIFAQYDNSVDKPNVAVLRTNFTSSQEGSMAKNFNLVESSNGKFEFAKFNYEVPKKTFLSRIGLSWGNSREEKQIVCDPKEIKRVPASIND